MNVSTRMHAVTAFLILMTAMSVRSAEKYAVNAIPLSLLPADAVIRESDERLVVKDEKRSTYSVIYAVTIFSKNEQNRGTLNLSYGRYVDIADLDGTIYDANGEEIRELNKRDIKDESAVAEHSLADESRCRTAVLIHDTFPYTVEFRYVLKFKSPIYWPEWIAQVTKLPVEHTSFTVTAPKDVPVRTWCNNPDVKPVMHEDGSKRSSEWMQRNIPKLSDDEAAESWYDITTMVKIAPSRFQMEDHEGSMETWKDFGAWYHQLYKDRQSLPEGARQEIQALVRPGQTDREKVKILYEYMQSRTRYVSIQLGIGGWQPFEASYVHARGYGDCKALTNYMDALLLAVGIRAYPVLINSGSNRISMITEFPSHQFDHVILCVPQPKDTIWLECTNQSGPFGRLGDFTENRPALLVSDSGGTVVHTPATRSAENLQSRSVRASLATTGSVTAEITSTVCGDQQLDLQESLLHASPEDRQTWLLEHLKTPNVTLSALSIEGLENRSPEITVRMTATLGRYAALNSSRLFFNPSLLTKRTYIPAENHARKSPVRYSYPFLDIDSIYVALPQMFTIETLPKDVNVRTSFGAFSCRTIAMGDTALMYIKRTEVSSSMIPPEKYPEYRSFHMEMVKADKAQVVLRVK
jgi:hypothetical protein